MAANKIILTVASVLLVVSAFTPYVLGIRCYQCNSFEDKHCENIQPKNVTHSKFLKDCDSGMYGNRPMFCRKIIQNIETLGVKQTRIIRKCSYEQSERECYHFEDDDHSEVVCQCFEDGCNKAGRSVSPTSLWGTILVVLAATGVSTLVATRC